MSVPTKDSHTLDSHTLIVVLAAGVSSRLGQPKQLLRWNGETLVSRMVREAGQVPRATVLVVTGAFRREVVKSLSGLEYDEVFNPDYLKGIGTSIKAAAEYCRLLASDRQKTVLRQGMLIVACDQIFVNHSVLNILIESFQKNPKADVTVCDYGKDLGLPSMISPRLWEDLGLLEDNEGAKKIWNSSRIIRQTISCPQALWDIDTQEDCRRFGIDV